MEDYLKDAGIDEKKFHEIVVISGMLSEFNGAQLVIALGMAVESWAGRQGKSREETTDLLKVLTVLYGRANDVLGAMSAEDVPKANVSLRYAAQDQNAGGGKS